MKRLITSVLSATLSVSVVGFVSGQTIPPPGKGEGTLQDTRGSSQPRRTNPNPTIQQEPPAVQGQAAPGVQVDRLGAFGAITMTPFFAEPALRKHLGLNNEQYTRLTAVYTAAYNTYVTRSNQLGNQPGDARAQRQQELANAFFSDFASAANGIVEPTQIVRLRQLWYQFRGFQAFHDPAVQQRLRLTPSQLALFQRYEGSFRERLAEVYRAANGNTTGASQGFINLRQQMVNDINTVLTHAQQRTWAEIVGDPYSFQPFATGPAVTSDRP